MLMEETESNLTSKDRFRVVTIEPSGWEVHGEFPSHLDAEMFVEEFENEHLDACPVVLFPLRMPSIGKY